MRTENNIYHNFKSYNQFRSNSVNDSKKSQSLPIKPLLGATIGVAGAIAVTKKLPKKADSTLHEIRDMLLMAGGANVGGVLGGSIGADKNQQAKKWKDAGFQVMNIAIPMLMVSGALEICKHTKALNKNLPKIIGSIAGMIGGAMIATGITNATREKDAPYRKYTIKDSVSNFDDIVATIKIGFKDILKYIPVDKILPFIYIYTGTRAGQKE